MLEILERRFKANLGPRTVVGCIEWTGQKTKKGYGLIRTGLRHSKTTAHRIAYLLHYGPIPDGLDVMHSCDNRACVNWEHLSVGTRQQNVDDMLRKNRQRKSVLNTIDFERIRDLHANGVFQREIAGLFQVSRPMISLILSGKAMPSDPYQS